jgi:AcrR family transcriptional regulator
MRDIARRANVGLATLFRHFPTREALFEALLRTNLDALTQKAGQLEMSNLPGEALVSWFREGVAFVDSYSGVVALMASADMDADDLFALISALGWLVDQPSFAPRADHLFHLITSAIVTSPSSKRRRGKKVTR